MSCHYWIIPLTAFISLMSNTLDLYSIAMATSPNVMQHESRVRMEKL